MGIYVAFFKAKTDLDYEKYIVGAGLSVSADAVSCSDS